MLKQSSTLYPLSRRRRIMSTLSNLAALWSRLMLWFGGVSSTLHKSQRKHICTNLKEYYLLESEWIQRNKSEKITGETLEIRSNKRKPGNLILASISINQHQSASIIININQSSSISNNQNQLASININQHQVASGWQMLRKRANSVHRKVRVFYERKDSQHT